MQANWRRRDVLGVGVSALGVALAGCSGTADGDEESFDSSLSVSSAQLFSAPGCSCCSAYASYLREHLESGLEETVPAGIGATKRRLGVPDALRSCHTVVLDDYVVEGHVPVAVVGRLLDETPPIDGIALPGMPAGSPGMGGEKSGPFTIYAFSDESVGEVYEEY